jgi:hypothetical protein
VIGRPQPVSIGELRAVLAHVRALDAPRQARRTTGQLAAVAAFVAILAGSLRAATTHAYLPSTRHQTIEESRMRTLQSLGVVSSIAIASAATAQNAVQWRVEDGGNGHWYSVAGPEPYMTWSRALSLAQSLGGHPVTFGGTAESQFVVAIVQSSPATLCPLGPWIGLVQDRTDPSYAEPAGGWRWIDGTIGPIVWQVPISPNNDCFGVAEDFANMTFDGQINDLAADPACTGFWPNGAINSVVIEWSADCNTDGLVDYGQIRSGQLADLNANNIPDCCEGAGTCLPCRADIDQSGAVNGVDLAAILNNWGTSGGKQPRSDVNADGIVDGADLAEVLNGWGSCP